MCQVRTSFVFSNIFIKLFLFFIALNLFQQISSYRSLSPRQKKSILCYCIWSIISGLEIRLNLVNSSKLYRLSTGYFLTNSKLYAILLSYFGLKLNIRPIRANILCRVAILPIIMGQGGNRFMAENLTTKISS